MAELFDYLSCKFLAIFFFTFLAKLLHFDDFWVAEKNVKMWLLHSFTSRRRDLAQDKKWMSIIYQRRRNRNDLLYYYTIPVWILKYNKGQSLEFINKGELQLTLYKGTIFGQKLVGPEVSQVRYEVRFGGFCVLNLDIFSIFGSQAAWFEKWQAWSPNPMFFSGFRVIKLRRSVAFFFLNKSLNPSFFFKKNLEKSLNPNLFLKKKAWKKALTQAFFSSQSFKKALTQAFFF